MAGVVIVGVGALGSHLVLALRNEILPLRVIDFDRVESKNVAAQFHAKTQVGKSKVVALQQTMQFLFGRKLEGLPHRLIAQNATELLSGADLVVDCLDNAASRRLVQQVTQKLNIPCLHGALAADGGFGRVVWDANFVIDEEGGAAVATCEDGAHLPFVMLVSAYLARSAQNFLHTGRKVGYEVSPAGAFAT